MSKKDNFKKFIFNHPEFIDYVKNNNVSWQTLFELYDLYGENMNVWNKYISPKNESINLKGVLNTLKNINLDSLEENIGSIQKAVNLIEEFTKSNDEEDNNVIAKETKIDKIYEDNNEK